MIGAVWVVGSVVATVAVVCLRPWAARAMVRVVATTVAADLAADLEERYVPVGDPLVADTLLLARRMRAAPGCFARGMWPFHRTGCRIGRAALEADFALLAVGSRLAAPERALLDGYRERLYRAIEEFAVAGSPLWWLPRSRAARSRGSAVPGEEFWDTGTLRFLDEGDPVRGARPRADRDGRAWRGEAGPQDRRRELALVLGEGGTPTWAEVRAEAGGGRREERAEVPGDALPTSTGPESVTESGIRAVGDDAADEAPVRAWGPAFLGADPTPEPSPA